MRSLFVVVAVLLVAPAAMGAGTYGQQAAENASRLLSQLMTVEVARSERVEVVSKEELEEALSLEASRAATGCNETSCMTRVAERLNSRYVVYGEVARVGEDLSFAITLFDTEQGTSAARRQVRGEGLTELARALPAEVETLLRALADDSEAQRVLVLDVRAEPSSFPPPQAGMPPLQGGLIQTIGGSAVASLALAPVGGLAALVVTLVPAANPTLLLLFAGVLAAGLVVSPFCCPCWSTLGSVLGTYLGDYLGHLDGSLIWPALTSTCLWAPLVFLPLVAGIVGAFLVPVQPDASNIFASLGIAGAGIVVAVIGLILSQAAAAAVYQLTASPAEQPTTASSKAGLAREVPPRPTRPSRARTTRVTMAF